MIVAVDISHWNRVYDWYALQAAGVKAVLAKATEGTFYRDDTYKHAQSTCRALGIKFGAYHFFHGGPGEASYFLDFADLAPDELAILDWENLPNGSAPSAAAAKGWMAAVDEKRGQKSVVYSGNVAKEKIAGRDAFFGAHWLWLAQYSRSWQVQQSWTQPWLWQYSESASVAGISGPADVNTIVSGTVEQWLADWPGGPAPTPAPVPPPEPVPPVLPWPDSWGPARGQASWYDDSANADGTPVGPNDMTAATLHVPFGQAIKATRPDTGKSCVVTIRDRGPYVKGRIIDFRPTPARALDMVDEGVVPIVLEAVGEAVVG